jgi:hypothetical protein
MFNTFKTEEEKKAYDIFCCKVAYEVYKQSEGLLKGMKKEDLNMESSKKIGDVVAYPLQDKVAELTKDMSREQLVQYLADTVGTMMVGRMRNSKEFADYIRLFGFLLDKV